jgi:UDP-N-acetylglucosamine diphosphorylase / glucose-1-phosphate thymidylyltransferase / UDP-N-acetylgalactosamine diphosphorylase / glucosamine-1-phosphate N-acetyltransferase / galactosamine-1-phosphate N-acetyltransferase
MPTQAILFDDAKGQLSPLNDLRASFEIRTGALTNAERLVAGLDIELVGTVVPTPLVELLAESSPVPVNRPPELDDAAEVLLINGRCPLPLDAIAHLNLGEVAIEKSSQDMVAVRLTAAGVRTLLTGGNPGMQTTEIDDAVLLSRPWSWRAFRDRCIAWDLDHFTEHMPKAPTAEGVVELGQFPICVHPSATVAPTVVLNAEDGPIVIDENAVVRPGAIITGPVYIGPGSTVLEHALIKPQTAIGPVCKVAGEIGGTVFQGYANKGHAGHLGDSWIGEWCNLGADTTNSNLLNTYTEITARATPDSKMEKTGQTFLGVTMGDHAKTAIGTRIMTGAIVGTGVMHAASTPISGTSKAFDWVTDAGTKTYRLGKFVEVAMTVMQRRGVTQSQPYARRLTVLHEMVTGEAAFDWPGKDKSHLPSQA